MLAGDAADNAKSGAERSTFTWDQTTGAFTTDTLVDTIADGGLSPLGGEVKIQIAGNTMTFHDPWTALSL